MKRASNYVPKYSLSIAYLREIMPPADLKRLIKDYVAYKKANWGKYKK